MLYNGLLKKSFDRTFNKLNLTWLPWVGKNYTVVSKKILVVGESNYGEGIEKNKNFTRDVINDFQIRFSETNQTFKNFDRLLSLESEEQIRTFWSKVAFYDYVQRPMSSPTDRPTNEDFENGVTAFNSIINTIKPDYILCIGVSALNYLINTNNPIIKKVTVHEPIGNCYPREAVLECKVKILAIHHTGQYFTNIEDWRKLIFKEFKELNNIISKG